MVMVMMMIIIMPVTMRVAVAAPCIQLVKNALRDRLWLRQRSFFLKDQ